MNVHEYIHTYSLCLCVYVYLCMYRNTHNKPALFFLNYLRNVPKNPSEKCRLKEDDHSIKVKNLVLLIYFHRLFNFG